MIDPERTALEDIGLLCPCSVQSAMFEFILQVSVFSLARLPRKPIHYFFVQKGYLLIEFKKYYVVIIGI